MANTSADIAAAAGVRATSSPRPDSRGKLFNRDYVNAAIEALSEIGGKAAVAALGEALLDDRPTAVLARAIERVGLKKAFEWLVESLDRDLTPESLWAIAALAPTVSKKRRAFAVRAIEKIEKQPFATMIAQQHALRRLGAAAPDLGMWVRTALAPEANPYSFAAGVAQKVWSLRAAAEHDDLEPEVITAWLTHENRQIHRAAAEAAARRGFEVVLRPSSPGFQRKLWTTHTASSVVTWIPQPASV